MTISAFVSLNSPSFLCIIPFHFRLHRSLLNDKAVCASVFCLSFIIKVLSAEGKSIYPRIIVLSLYILLGFFARQYFYCSIPIFIALYATESKGSIPESHLHNMENGRPSPPGHGVRYDGAETMDILSWTDTLSWCVHQTELYLETLRAPRWAGKVLRQPCGCNRTAAKQEGTDHHPYWPGLRIFLENVHRTDSKQQYCSIYGTGRETNR